MEKQIQLTIDFKSCPSTKEIKRVLKAIPNATFKYLTIWEKLPFTPEELAHSVILKLIEQGLYVIDINGIMSILETMVILNNCKDVKIKTIDWDTPQDNLIDTIADAIVHNINLYYEEIKN
jgi:hypothetical protein